MLSFYAFLVHKSRIVYGVRHTPIPIHAEAHDMQTIKPWYTHHQHAHMRTVHQTQAVRFATDAFNGRTNFGSDSHVYDRRHATTLTSIEILFCVDCDFFLLFFCGWFQLKCASILNLIFRLISILHSHMDSKWLNNEDATITPTAWQFVFEKIHFNLQFINFFEILRDIKILSDERICYILSMKLELFPNWDIN